eukprot:COSAG02_NODE_3179_length_7218_cov_2.022194_1_plen_125_part_10
MHAYASDYVPYRGTRLFQSQGAPAARRSISLSVIQGPAVVDSIPVLGTRIIVSIIPRRTVHTYRTEGDSKGQPKKCSTFWPIQMIYRNPVDHGGLYRFFDEKTAISGPILRRENCDFRNSGIGHC